MTVPTPARPTAIAILALALLFCALPARAAQLNGVTGTWSANLKTHFTIKGYGGHKAKGDGNCVLTLVDNLNASFACAGFDTTAGQTYSGNLSALVRRDKLGWSLDTQGLDQAKANMTQWLIARNLKKGRQLAAENVGYEFLRFSYKPIRLKANLTQPAKANATIKGRVTQLVNDRYVIKPFTYQIAIKYLSRAP
ncbi:hypothetical protein SAMN02949497_2979 [Methylomagnum ishizawai]|uniref:Uncharacterized protein n=1 Tax=Methylomagnum ishizawai TaxID=1760988 RepID=A0A1Y6D5G4_9GAMM|nr:hypothetical protein [Methylomagnum ishizawai]SMF95614.1 hypothetical protein SAMN02949497_2979 [Methylomagnum ishizawai]